MPFPKAPPRGALSYRQIHALIRARLTLLNATCPEPALGPAPAYTSLRGILQQFDPALSYRGLK